MCTALQYNKFFGRNLDLDYSYEEKVTITPRNYVFKFRHQKNIEKHYAMIGMAFTQDNYPLYYDASNEYGLSMAGLNFPNNAQYGDLDAHKDNIAPFEFIPWVLAQCKTVSEAKKLCAQLNLVNTHFSQQLPNSPLHWIIADKERSITVESTKTGLQIYDNPVGVLTNNPTFDKQLFNLNNYKHLSSKAPVNTFSPTLPLENYSLGMGSIGLPGDVSSMGRFVRICFFKENSVIQECEAREQFFHLLQSVYQPKGGTYVSHSEKYEYTLYTSCVDMDACIYYYKTYCNSDLNAVDMKAEDLEADTLTHFDLIMEPKVHFQNHV